ncbi:uncharacterized protein PV09_02922 [Verruconis gallopava]|uniref:Enoyl-CoA hydratase n=1 Tax=Verruconis gallopava TaxID=253628 RepID=A0A0D1XUR7_9PEZI|nr:uncharacterized protein PV09_02922 [Verruconis gallopava]KIW06486.1 hypothetical protein PV09_02922 [Verruconis gallopava]
MSFKYISVKQEKPGVFVIILNKPPENRLTVASCQEIIQAYRHIEHELGRDSEGAVILTSFSSKFFTTGLDLDERERNPFASTDGFYPLLATILDFPFPTICLITGHVFGGACLLSLAHDYRVMNRRRGYFQMPPVNLGLHHPGMGTLLNAKLAPPVRRKVLLEAHKYTATEALADGIIDVAEEPENMLQTALALAEKWKSKAKMGVYSLLRGELVGEAARAYRDVSYIHGRETTREPKMKL